MMLRRGRLAALMVVFGALAVYAACASSASAVLLRMQDGRVVSYQPLRGAVRARPFDSAFTNLDYNGGPVMASNTDYLIFWSPTGYGAYGSGSPPEYVSGLEQYFTDLSHDSGGHQNTDSVSAQYNDLTGAFARYAVTFGGAFLDQDPYPTSKCPTGGAVSNCLVDPQIEAELEKFASANHLRRDLTHEFFLLTPPGVEGCFDNNINDPGGAYGGCSAGSLANPVFCSYHQQTTVSPMLIYADTPYVTGNPGCDDGNHPNGPSDGALEGGLSHEHNESITDPIPNDAWTNGAGANQGMEVGDQCDGTMGTPLGTAPDGAKYNQVINGHFYWYQEEWSNDGHTCLQRYTPPGTLPTAKFTATAGSGLTMTFDATPSSAPGGVADFSWQFNALADQATFEQTTPSIAHPFPATGAYSIGLTAYGSSGLAAGAGGIITTGHSGFTPAFTSSPTSPLAGQTVTFKGLTTVSQEPVTSYLWEFGDGSTGLGANPTHTYAKAGTYHVTVVLFSGVGSAFPGTGAAPVYAHEIVVKRPTSTTAAAPATDTVKTAIATSAISARLASATTGATGGITFKVFGPQSTAPTSCTTGGTTVGTATVGGAGTYHPSARFTPTKAGNYWWHASYSGDANNGASASTCGASMPATAVSA